MKMTVAFPESLSIPLYYEYQVSNEDLFSAPDKKG